MPDAQLAEVDAPVAETPDAAPADAAIAELDAAAPELDAPPQALPDAAAAPDAGQSALCPELVLAGNDATYLGAASSSTVLGNSVCNPFGLYGSTTGLDSIHNPYGTYGSPYNLLSAYDPYTLTPPHLVCLTNGAQLNHVTKNAFLADVAPLIDPDLLCAVLAGNGY